MSDEKTSSYTIGIHVYPGSHIEAVWLNVGTVALRIDSASIYLRDEDAVVKMGLALVEARQMLKEAAKQAARKQP